MNIKTFLKESFYDLQQAAVLSSENVGDTGEEKFFLEYVKSLRERFHKHITNEDIVKLAKQDIIKIKQHLDGIKSYPSLIEYDEVELKSFINSLELGIKAIKKNIASGNKPKRTSNEAVVNKIINDLTSKYQIPVIEFDTKGTRVSEVNISDLKRDQKLRLPNGIVFNFETKQGDIRDMHRKSGLLFAEVRKKFSSLKKHELEAIGSQVADHNIKLEKDFPEEKLKEIEDEIESSFTKPYLIVGKKEDTSPENIFVIHPDSYYLKLRISPYLKVSRVGLFAYLNEESNIETLKEFFSRMVVEKAISKINKNVKHLKEEFKDFLDKDGKTTIYKNVDLKDFYEIKKATLEAFKNSEYYNYKDSNLIEKNFLNRIRGVMNYNGELYSIGPQLDLIHEDMVVDLAKKGLIKNHASWWININSLKNFLCVETSDGKLWTVSESYVDEIIDSEDLIKYFNHYSDKFKKLRLGLRL